MDPNQVQENNNASPQGHTIKYLIKPKVEGLGGWLVLVQISLYFSLIGITFVLFSNVFPLFRPEVWSLFTDPADPYYDSLLPPLIIFESVVNVLFVIVLAVALVFMYRKKKAFPLLMIGYITANVLFCVADYAATTQIEFLAEFEAEDGQSQKAVGRSILYACIWIPYFIRSKRVRNTFVN